MKKIFLITILLLMTISLFAEFPQFSTGFSPSNTYKQLLFIYNGTGDENTGITTTLEYVMDGGGTAAPFQMNTTSIRMDTGAKIEFSTASMFIYNDGVHSLTIDGDETLKLAASNEIDLTSSGGIIDVNIGPSGSVNIDGPTTITGAFTASGDIKVDAISEETADNGVDIDGLSIKDGGFDAGILTDTIDELTATTGVTIDGVLCKDNGVDASGIITVDTIDEHTSTSGVTIDGVVLKDNGITATSPVIIGAGSSTDILDAYGTVAVPLGITTSSIKLGKLSNGSVVSPTIGHFGNTDTYIEFDATADKTEFISGTKTLLTLEETTQDLISLGDGTDVDTRIRTNGEDDSFFVRGSDGYCGFGTTTPTRRVTISDTYGTTVAGLLTGNIAVGSFSTTSGAGRIFNNLNTDNYIEIEYTDDEINIGSATKVGVGIEDPLVKLDVHHDPTGLANNTGGGDVVTFGSEDVTDVLLPGRFMYLDNISSTWKYVDADAVGTSGYCLVGIALGSDISDGVLLRGYFDATSYLSSFSVGKTIYISTTTGWATTTAPATVGDTVRALGWCTETANVIYFNPDGHYYTN
jgi:hypothetical protein